jgi:hypothetical protein
MFFPAFFLKTNKNSINSLFCSYSVLFYSFYTYITRKGQQIFVVANFFLPEGRTVRHWWKGDERLMDLCTFQDSSIFYFFHAGIKYTYFPLNLTPPPASHAMGQGFETLYCEHTMYFVV